MLRICIFLVLIFYCQLGTPALNEISSDAGAEDDEEIDTGINDFDIPTRANSDCGKLDPTGKPPLTAKQYGKLRDDAYKEEDSFRLGGSLTLNKLERRVNDILMWFKHKEFEQGVVTNGDRIIFPAGIHFFHAKKYIKDSNVYKIIRIMPKGGQLHLHDLQTGSVEFNVELTKRMPNLYTCWDADSVLRFQFLKFPPSATVTDFCVTDWVTVEDFRKNSSSADYMNDIFYKKMSLETETPEIDYPDNNAAWRVFTNTITTSGGLLGYEKAAELYFYNLFQEIYDDNIQYAEIRSLLEYFYRIDDDNPNLTAEETLELIKRVNDKFVRTHPDFWGIKIIISPVRTLTRNQMATRISEAIRLKKLYPEFLAGFDIVNHEDKGNPLYFYRDELLRASAQGLKFFFHAGETGSSQSGKAEPFMTVYRTILDLVKDWHGTKIDDNILDAVLLNATRIGHGTAMNSRPYLVDLIRQKGIGVEMNPISSQILKLSSSDMRTHPTIPFIRNGFPMTISSDNPGTFGTNNLSYDWYMTFMAMAGERADLRFLKQLALNSIKYSAMCDNEKRQNLRRWHIKWNAFLRRVVHEYSTIATPRVG